MRRYMCKYSLSAEDQNKNELNGNACCDVVQPGQRRNVGLVVKECDTFSKGFVGVVKLARKGPSQI